MRQLTGGAEEETSERTPYSYVSVVPYEPRRTGHFYTFRNRLLVLIARSRQAKNHFGLRLICFTFL